MNLRKLAIVLFVIFLLNIIILIFFIKPETIINRNFYGKTDNWIVELSFVGIKPLKQDSIKDYKYGMNYNIIFIGDEKAFYNKPLLIKIDYSSLSGPMTIQIDNWNTNKNKKFKSSTGSGSYVAMDMLDYFDTNKEINPTAYISMGSEKETFLLNEVKK